jgi:hypothetical protein
MRLVVPFQPASADYPNYPNHLALPQPERLALPPAYVLLGLLLALCLVPRMIMALRIPSVCPDGVLYIRLAQALEAGQWHTGLQDSSLRPYPIILMVLHRLGLDWQWAASLWGVAASCLVVLPLWGWVRRQFDQRVALVACLLYAVNPKFIEWSPEVMRDPTFWLLFMLTIYWLWRGVTEVRYGWFVAGGAALTLAALTRIEGLLLLIPLALWTFWRFRALETDRKKLLCGAVLCVATFPLLLALVNLGGICGHSGLAAPRLSPVARVQPWFESLVGHATAARGGAAQQSMTVGHMLWVFFPTLTRGLSPVFALLMFGGIWGWRRVWGRRDHQPLFYVALAIMFGVWVQLSVDRAICPRYALPIVLMASPLAALGFLGMTARLLRIADRLRWGDRRRTATLAAAAVVVVAVSLADAMTSNSKYFPTRRMAADVGRWVRRQFPAPPPAIVGPVGITPIVSFYADTRRYQAFRWEDGDASILALIDRSRATVVLLQPARELTKSRCDALAKRLKDAGLKPVCGANLPTTCADLAVFVRDPCGTRVVQAQEPSRAR